MHRPTHKAKAGSFLLAALTLTSCGTQSLKLGDEEVNISTAVISELESTWKAHRNVSRPSNIADSSGCYVAAADKELTGFALCGPIRYSEEQISGWDKIAIDITDPDDVNFLSANGTFQFGPLDTTTDLVRHDGSEAPRGLEIPDPSAVRELEPFSILLDDEKPTAIDPVTVKLPYKTKATISEGILEKHVEDGEERIAAPEGFLIASVSYSAESLIKEKWVGTGLAFIVDGTTYPLETPPGAGKASIVVPAQSNVSFALEYDNVTQQVRIPDLSLDPGSASILYANTEQSSYITEAINTSKVRYQSVAANKFPHFFNPQHPLGWAGKDRIWIRANLEMATPPGQLTLMKSTLQQVNAVMTLEDGTQVTPEKTTVKKVPIRDTWSVESFYNVPADVGDTTWQVSAQNTNDEIYESGPIHFIFNDD